MTIRNVCDFIIPNLETGPKSPLLKAMKSLLEAASSGSQRRSVLNEKQTTQIAPPAFNTSGYDPRAHGGMIPDLGMSGRNGAAGSQMSTGTTVRPMASTSGSDTVLDPVLSFDVNAIDWEEFDRLARELSGQ